jgi:hypothetical protein
MCGLILNEIILFKLKKGILTYIIAIVWFVNGFFCKVLNFVPRHQEIVSRILGNEYASILTKTIGFSEIIMTIWILSKFKSRLNAIMQILIISVMNIMEFFTVPNLLLWGKLNSVFAFLFILLIYYNEFMFNKSVKCLDS